MNTFPSYLISSNKDNFSSIYKDKILLNKFRKDIFLFMLSRENENSYFDIVTWCNKNSVRLRDNMDVINRYIDIIIQELITLNWKCKTSFNRTGIFIYSSEQAPPSCNEDDVLF